MKHEEYLQEEFDLLHVDVQICHFYPNVYQPGTAEHGISSVTVAHTDDINANRISQVLDYIEFSTYLCADSLPEKVACILETLTDRGYPGTFVSTDRKPEDVQRIAAQGRLLKHLRSQENAYATT